MQTFERHKVETLAAASHIQREITAALAAPDVTSLPRFLHHLFCGPPNTAPDNSYVPERFAIAKALVDDNAIADTVTLRDLPAEPLGYAGSSAFASSQLPSETPGSFRFVDGTLRVPGNLVLTGQLLVAGDLHVDGAIHSGDWQALMVVGDVHCRALECSESYVFTGGSLHATEFVLIDDCAEVTVAGDLMTRGLLIGELGGSGITVHGTNHARHLELDDEANQRLFAYGLIGPEDALFSWHLMRAVMHGKAVWSP